MILIIYGWKNLNINCNSKGTWKMCILYVWCMLCYKNIVISLMGERALKAHVARWGKHKELVTYKNSAAKKTEMYFTIKSEDIIQPPFSSSQQWMIESLILNQNVLDTENLWTLNIIKHNFSYKSKIMKNYFDRCLAIVALLKSLHALNGKLHIMEFLNL